MERLLIINPGSTSTKIAVYDDDKQLFLKSIAHSAEELAVYAHVTDQLEFRTELVLKTLQEEGIALDSLTGVVARGGLLPPIQAGAYRINEDMVWQLKYKPQHEHASNVGALIADSIARQQNIPAFIYDGVTVDEMDPINKISGLKGLYWKGMGHNLNTRAAAIRYAEEQGKDYNDMTLIVAHLGGGISVNLHHKGRIVDFVNDELGTFSPERTGRVPLFDLIEMCYSDGNTQASMMKTVKTRGGLVSHLGTNDSREVEKMIAGGDEYAKLVYEAMALNVAKDIGKVAPYVCGKIDAIILTGGIAYSKYFTSEVSKWITFLAPVVIYPGENEMDALAAGGLRVLQGKEEAREFTRVE